MHPVNEPSHYTEAIINTGGKNAGNNRGNKQITTEMKIYVSITNYPFFINCELMEVGNMIINRQ